MPEDEHPAARYRRLASQSLEVAGTFPPSEQRTALLHMAQVWQRLADQYADSTPPLFQPDTGEQPASRHIDRDAIGERDHRTDTRDRHQPPAHIVVPDDGQQAAM